jgi:hypothetical protein
MLRSVIEHPHFVPMETADKAQRPPQTPSNDAVVEAFAADDPRDTLQLSGKEELILQLYDQLKELRLESCILEAQKDPPSTSSGVLYPALPANVVEDPQDGKGSLEEQVAIAKRQLLEAQATYSIRRRVEENVMAVNPTLKAVHATERASIPER